MSAMSIFLGIWNHNNFDNYLASRLYKIQPFDEDDSRGEEIKPTRFFNVCEWLYDLVPSCLRCRCFHKTHRMIGIEKAREQLANEINIVEIVRSRRLINKAIKLLLPKEKHSEFFQSA